MCARENGILSPSPSSPKSKLIGRRHIVEMRFLLSLHRELVLITSPYHPLSTFFLFLFGGYLAVKGLDALNLAFTVNDLPSITHATDAELPMQLAEESTPRRADPLPGGGRDTSVYARVNAVIMAGACVAVGAICIAAAVSIGASADIGVINVLSRKQKESSARKDETNHTNTISPLRYWQAQAR